MKKATKWAAILAHYITRAASTIRLSRRCSGPGGVWLLVGLLLIASPAPAATVEGGDILVADQGANKIFVVNPVSGIRSVLSDFSNPAQGPLGRELTSVAISHGQIFVGEAFVGIFRVDPATGNRTIVSNFNQGTIQGNLYYGLAAELTGELVANLFRFNGISDVSVGVVGVAPATDTRTIVSDFSNPSQGPVLSSCCLMTDLTPEHSRAILIGTADNADNGSHPFGIYRVNPVTGFRTLLSDFTNPAQGADRADFFFSEGLAVERSGQILANSGDTGYAPRTLLLRIDPVTGNRTVLSDFDNPAQGPLGFFLVGMGLERSGQVVVAGSDPVTGAQKVFRVDPLTGKRTLLSDGSNPAQGPSLTGIVYLAVVPDNQGFFAPPPANMSNSPFGPAK